MFICLYPGYLSEFKIDLVHQVVKGFEPLFGKNVLFVVSKKHPCLTNNRTKAFCLVFKICFNFDYTSTNLSFEAKIAEI